MIWKRSPMHILSEIMVFGKVEMCILNVVLDKGCCCLGNPASAKHCWFHHLGIGWHKEQLWPSDKIQIPRHSQFIEKESLTLENPGWKTSVQCWHTYDAMDSKVLVKSMSTRFPNRKVGNVSLTNRLNPFLGPFVNIYVFKYLPLCWFFVVVNICV